ncbi:MAG TPA: selenocysteine-specific translation elongation factor [Terriglobales bacterium]|nr:selenocysteine-specific translation elongation factor [Terriglobales bacterium]
MKSVVIGTAGHIDHGKTALVKALTGIDADRLDEEKRRGITIDLGFAHLELPGPNGETLRFGFVDVPGHERFVRNMLAGAGGMDLVLLVVAADEGVKPQTREHFEICRLLCIRHGMVVLTKADLVDPETLAVARLELEDFVRGSFLEGAPVLPVSALKGTGLDELKQQLVRIASQAQARDANAIVRFPIDRVFSMKGFGTVVTGTLIAGTIHKEDELELFPSRRKVRVRGIQVHGKNADRAVAGERTALNLAGVEKHELARGMTLASPGLLKESSRFHVELSLLSTAKPLKTGARVHLHAFASETIATVQLYENKNAQAGATSFAHLRTAEPLLLVPGDRFIVRQFSPVITIGGGVVLDASPLRKPRAENLSFLTTLATADRARVLEARVSRRGSAGLAISDAVAESGWTKREIESLQKSDSQLLPHIPVLIFKRDFTSLTARITDAISQFHKQNPLTPGIAAEALRRVVGSSDWIFDFAVDSLLRTKKIESTEGLIRLSGHGIVMKDEESESRKLIEQAFASTGLKVPALKDVVAGLKIDKTRAQKIVTLLLRDKVLVKVSEDLVFHQSALLELRKSLAAEKQRSPKIDVGRFKDLTGVTRKYAIPLLEYLDRERVTRREGDARRIL